MKVFNQQMFGRLCLWLSTLLLCAAANSAVPPWQKLSFIEQSFYEVALGSEYGQATLLVRKWVKPLRIYVEHQQGNHQLHDELLNAHISHLQQITGLDIKRVSKRSQSNIDFFFTSQKMMPALVEREIDSASLQYIHGSVCLASVTFNQRQEVDSADVFIPIDQARMHGKLVSCIVEELTQILGLIRDSDLVYPSIFNDKSQDQLLTGLDEILLRLLYEPAIVSGMNKQQLSPILAKLLEGYRAKNMIATASKRVQQGELYRLLGFRHK